MHAATRFVAGRLAAGTALAILAMTGGTMASDTPCGVDALCEIEGGAYRVHLPSGWDGKTPLPGVVYFHGWQGSADGVMANAGLTGAADELGVLLIVPDGMEKTWSYPGSPAKHRDEIAFLDAVLDDAEARYPIETDTLVGTGFSMGGSMAWFAACALGDRFAGFVPVAGAYWDPIPTDCPSPAPNLVHVHGTSDTVVPMEGRPIRQIYRQSDVGDSLASWTARAGCEATTKPAELGDLACERWVGCGGTLIELCTHPGGHMIKPEWVVDGYRRLMRHLGRDGQAG